MEQENEQAQEGVEEQEENTQEESDYTEQEETVTIPKQKFVKMQRKAQAYDAKKDERLPKQNINNNSDAKWREKVELRVDGYDDQAVEFIQKNGGKKALENPYILKAIEAMKEQHMAERATIDEGSKSESERQFNPKDFAKLTASEQIKVLSNL